MSRYNKPKSWNWKDYLIQLAIAIVSIFIIVWFLPRDEQVMTHIEVGRPWPYGRLIAPYDFPIFKTEAQLQLERDSIQKIYEPYFELLSNVETQGVNDFRTDFRAQAANKFPLTYRTYVEGKLREIYHQGIIDANDLQFLQISNKKAIRIYHGTEATSVPVSQLFTEKSAYEHFFIGLNENVINRSKLQHLDLNKYINPNIAYDENKSQELWKEMESSLSPSSGMVIAGQNIIDRGVIVTEQTYQILKSYERESAKRKQVSVTENRRLMGQVLYVAIICISLIVYFNLFRQDYVSNPRAVSLLLVLILTFPLLTSAVVRHTFFSVYVIPYAMLPVFVRIFMDSRTAFFTHVSCILLCAISLSYPFEFITTQLVAGLVATYSMREMSERSQLIRTAFLVTVSALLIYYSLDLVHGRSFFGKDTMTGADLNLYIHIVISGVLLLFAYPLMAMIERLFGFTSNVTLVELSNVNRELLRQLSEKAPGTFQHSMQVANLAAEVANKLGAKTQLVRTGALYHDIGKMANPEYFTENQIAGNNPHQSLSNKESAAIILRHVTDGEELADRNRLPRAIRDFISTHHGKGVAKYFYITEKNEHPDEVIDIEDYTYKGPNPKTMEQAILMMTDAVEASARSLKEYTNESIGELVDRIIDGQVSEGFFTECPITFQDIHTAKDVLKTKLKTIYHTRVSYPTLKTETESEGSVPSLQSGSTSK